MCFLEVSAGLPECDDSTENRIWPRKSVLALIECYKANQEDMQDPRRKKKNVWYSISEMMKEKGECVTAEMCSRKWRNLRGTYKAIKNNTKLSESRRRRWEFFDLMHEILINDDTDSLSISPSTSANPDDFVDEGYPRKSTVATLKRYLKCANEDRCAELKKLRENIEELNRLNREKNEILKDALKERNLILRESLREKNDILKKLLASQLNIS